MLLRYNVSHMGQHFWIKQSGMKRSSALVFPRSLLPVQFHDSIFLLFSVTVKTKERVELKNSFYFSLNIHLDSIKLSCPVNCETGKVGKRPFSQAAQADFGLKEKHRNERKGTSKLASCHRALVWSHLPFSGWSVSKPWSKRDTSSSIPPFQEMSVPHCPTAITSCGPGSPKQRSASFSRAAGVQKKKYNSYL